MINNVNISKKKGTRQTFAVPSEQSKTLYKIYNVDSKLSGATGY
jgi:hypothetical protein